MKFRKIISVVFAMFLGFNNQCFALLTSEEYYSCFENQELSEIIINKLVKKDEEVLKNMIDDDTDFSKWLGNGTNNFNSDEYLEDLKSNCKLIFTIKNAYDIVLGFVYMNQGSDEHQLEVGYWIGKQFRGNGYVHLAVSKIISKIWEKDNSVSFAFDIDDENIASIKTLEKICSDLEIDLKSSRFEKNKIMSLEVIVERNEDDTYLFQSYFDGVLNIRKTVPKEKILELYSEDKIADGIHIKQSSSKYLLKNS